MYYGLPQIFLLLLAPVIVFCQKSDSIQIKEYCNCARHSKLLNDYSRFVPGGNTPAIRLRANFIFLQNDKGEGGFSEDNELHQKYLDEIIGKPTGPWNSLNNRYANMEDKNPGSNCYDGFVKDS